MGEPVELENVSRLYQGEATGEDGLEVKLDDELHDEPYEVQGLQDEPLDVKEDGKSEQPEELVDLAGAAERTSEASGYRPSLRQSFRDTNMDLMEAARPSTAHEMMAEVHPRMSTDEGLSAVAVGSVDMDMAEAWQKYLKQKRQLERGFRNASPKRNIIPWKQPSFLGFLESVHL